MKTIVKVPVPYFPSSSLLNMPSIRVSSIRSRPEQGTLKDTYSLFKGKNLLCHTNYVKLTNILQYATVVHIPTIMIFV